MGQGGKMEAGLEKIIESLSNKKVFMLSREEFKLLKRGIRIQQDFVDEYEGIVKGFHKWYETWKEQISLPTSAIIQLNAVFEDLNKRKKLEK